MHNVDLAVTLIACLGLNSLTTISDEFPWLSIMSVIFTILATIAVACRNIIRVVQDCKKGNIDQANAIEDITEEIADAANSVAAELQSNSKISDDGENNLTD